MKIAPVSAIVTLASFGFFFLDYPIAMPHMMRSAFANSSYQVQETTISLSSEDLFEPHWLRIKSSSSLSYLSGSISCNGRVIKYLGNGTTEVDLSPYLRSGRNNVVVLGRYSPSITMIDVDFDGPNNQVSQSISGSGILNQNIRINVQ